jgi:predicted ATPase
VNLKSKEFTKKRFCSKNLWKNAIRSSWSPYDQPSDSGEEAVYKGKRGLNMNENQLSRIVLRGFKSIRECDLKLKELNVLIGPNGAGKSNFIGFFRLIQQLLEGNLQVYVGKQGGPDALLHFGRKKTDSLDAELYFGNNGYKFSLEPTQDNRMMFANEKFWWNIKGDWNISSGHFETRVESQKGKTGLYDFTVPPMKTWRVYHFHDTSENAWIKQLHGINDNLYLRPDARNLAAFLYLLKNQHHSHYARIVKTIRLAAPFFGDFSLRPNPENTDKIELEWFEKGEDIPFKAHLLSDGTLRFICLVTVLMQPEEFQPETILIDEPELGLHPFAINLLASLLRSTSKQRQVIVSTQSADLLNEFSAEDVIVADRTEGYTSLHHLDPEDLQSWLEEYTLGELWQKNILGGRPSR